MQVQWSVLMATKRSKSSATSANKKVGKVPVEQQRKDFSREELYEINDKLVTARIGLLLKHPFFGNLATRLKMIDASDWCATLATDGRNFYYSNDFVSKLTPKEIEFGFAHEILHIVFDHFGRREFRDPQLANIAADYAVNQILVDEKIGEVPKIISIYQDDKYRGMAFEEIYDEIMKNVKTISLSDLGELLDDHLDDGSSSSDGKESEGSGNSTASGKPSLTEEERKQIRDEMKNAIISAAQAAQAAGSLPAAVARLITALTEHKMDWRQLLRTSIQSILRSNYSFNRPNRKSQHSGAILPGAVNEMTIDVAVALDMSGSISNEQAAAFLAEVKGIMEEFKDFRLDLMCFDTDVYNFQTFSADTSDDISSYEPKGGGGTDFDCIWNYLKEIGITPKRLILFTDMYPCGSWGDPDYCETLFVGHGTTSIVAPFGQTVYYTE